VKRTNILVLLTCLLACSLLPAEQVAVRHKEGLLRGFLVVRTLEGEIIADGDLFQVARGDRVTTRLTFRFKDGSLHDETAVFSQRGSFRLLSNHLVQKGPSFRHPLDATFDAATGRVTVRYDADGKEKTASSVFAVPPDVANGMTLTLMKNIVPGASRTTVSMVAYAAKPRLIKLIITQQGEEAFSTGNTQRKAMHYVVRFEVGGFEGWVAERLGKLPPDVHVWVLGGKAPTIVRSQGPLALDGPIWRIELVSPQWPRDAAASLQTEQNREKKQTARR
jgi:hypothetical protein